MTGKNSDEFRKLKEDAENDLEKATELVNKLKEEYIKCIYNKCRLKCILNLS